MGTHSLKTKLHAQNLQFAIADRFDGFALQKARSDFAAIQLSSFPGGNI
jgi:hypothetical protein